MPLPEPRDGPRDWDALTYDRIADPMARWGADVLARLPLDGDETVLDAGCGSGRVTELLLERLPRGQVIALDGSPSMIDAARARLAGHDDRVTFLLADLARPLPMARASTDAILSTATFHWVPDHDGLFRNLAAVLRPGGRLVAQCGGDGNIASILRALSDLGDGWSPWLFPTPGETRRRLAAAGFTEIETWLNDEPVRLAPGQQLLEYLQSVVLGAHVERLRPSERLPFVTAVAARLPVPAIDYVRLNIVATRAG
jgi:trans-aconitate 2-methyltransferase